jgi:hypothetical protein
VNRVGSRPKPSPGNHSPAPHGLNSIPRGRTRRVRRAPPPPWVNVSILAAERRHRLAGRRKPPVHEFRFSSAERHASRAPTRKRGRNRHGPRSESGTTTTAARRQSTNTMGWDGGSSRTCRVARRSTKIIVTAKSRSCWKREPVRPRTRSSSSFGIPTKSMRWRGGTGTATPTATTPTRTKVPHYHCQDANYSVTAVVSAIGYVTPADKLNGLREQRREQRGQNYFSKPKIIPTPFFHLFSTEPFFPQNRFRRRWSYRGGRK